MAAEKTKTYTIGYEDYDSGEKSAENLVADILADPEFPALTELVIGDWGGAWEDDCQAVLDGIVEHAEQFSHIQRLFVGDMDYEQCEVSWIMQGDYSKLWAALPDLKSLTIKGSTELRLGEVCHEGLESLTIICGGLPSNVILAIQKAKLPNLKKLLLYIGVENYGFDGDADMIRTLLAEADFPKLKYLGIADSEIQDELAEVVLDCKFMGQLETLDLSCGTLSDKGAALLVEKLPAYPNIQLLDIHHHYLTDAAVESLGQLPIEIDVSDQNEAEVYRGEVWMNAILTE